MRIEVVTLFPEWLRSLGGYGVVGRAVEQGRVAVGARSPRDYAADMRRTVDDRPYGGGPGMVLGIEPTRTAVRAAMADVPAGSRRICLAADGVRFDHRKAAELAALPGMVLLAGRYEGIDERLIATETDECVSIGDYVLSGGELPALVLIDAVVRLLPGALGASESAAEDSYAAGLLDWPHYTRPESVDGLDVPAVLLGGHHAAIRRWRMKQSLGRTWLRRPDLLRKVCLDAEQRTLLDEFLLERDRAGEPV